MKTKMMMEKKAADGKRISLFTNHRVKIASCHFCGAHCNLQGFDFCIGDNFVCDACAEKYAPELVLIQQEAFKYAKSHSDCKAWEIKTAIEEAINEPIQKRIMKAINEIVKSDDETGGKESWN